MDLYCRLVARTLTSNDPPEDWGEGFRSFNAGSLPARTNPEENLDFFNFRLPLISKSDG